MRRPHRPHDSMPACRPTGRDRHDQTSCHPPCLRRLRGAASGSARTRSSRCSPHDVPATSPPTARRACHAWRLRACARRRASCASRSVGLVDRSMGNVSAFFRRHVGWQCFVAVHTGPGLPFTRGPSCNGHTMTSCAPTGSTPGRARRYVAASAIPSVVLPMKSNCITRLRSHDVICIDHRLSVIAESLLRHCRFCTASRRCSN